MLLCVVSVDVVRYLFGVGCLSLFVRRCRLFSLVLVVVCCCLFLLISVDVCCRLRLFVVAVCCGWCVLLIVACSCCLLWLFVVCCLLSVVCWSLLFAVVRRWLLFDLIFLVVMCKCLLSMLRVDAV